MTTANKTQTLAEFLDAHGICRVWMAGVGCPAGQELILNLEGDGEDYCDAQSLLDFIPGGAEEVDGTVIQDSDGEWRWEVGSLEEVDLYDDRGNTIYNLVVWGA